MQNQVKKAWQQPALEVLNVNMTMAGPGLATPDAVQPDPTEIINFS
ncbi:hypothetical protein FHS16_000097 [Paenibacillus endophyticus]|uniref:Paeninodin family lasso peptide n=1 Tax=Paenibacillus endophyticus TaxID=1294268 RepID=A0A7W5C2S7_9BACL|nr:hypothetical protein [Paenibacillus endophyticus]